MSLETQLLYEFGKFRCIPREHLLLCEGKPVSLSPKSFEILVALIQSNGRLLTKDELMRQVWPDSFVEEANLTVNISALRKALGEVLGGQQYIETVPKCGYRFVAAVHEFMDDGKSSPVVSAAAVQPSHEAPSPANQKHRALRWWLLATGLLLAASLIFMAVISRRSARFTGKDEVVLADFANTTGDAVFDDALRQGLSSQLEQSPFLNLVSDERVAQTLSLMAKPKDSRLIQDLARDVCQRTAAAAVLNGSIAQVGTQYLLTLKAINCSSGESLGSAEAQAADKNHVLEALGNVASQIRNQLGESLASVQKYDAPAESVTTPSLDALKAYSLGYQDMVVKSDYAGAIQQFQRAIALDPNFAMAHARLGTSYSNVNDMVRSANSARRAFELRARVSEREQFYIDSHYEIFITGNLEAARKVAELSAQTYPRDTSFTNLGIIYSELGEHDKALVAFKDALTLNPETGYRYANLVNGYLALNRLDDAKAAAREAQRHKIDSPELHLSLYWVDFLQHDDAAMDRGAATLMGIPGHEDQMLNYQADTAFYGGQLAKAREFTRRAVESAQKAGEKEACSLYQAESALREALVGNVDLAKAQAHAALGLSTSRDVQALSAVALAVAGESTQADRLAKDLAKRFPEDTIVHSHYLPAILGATGPRSDDRGQTTEGVVAPLAYELGGNLGVVHFVLYPAYIRGKSYLAAKQGPAAAVEFQKILDHPGLVRNEPIAALARLELGRAYALSGEKARANTVYQEFFSLWKDADPEIPLLRHAKAEFANLK